MENANERVLQHVEKNVKECVAEYGDKENKGMKFDKDGYNTTMIEPTSEQETILQKKIRKLQMDGYKMKTPVDRFFLRGSSTFFSSLFFGVGAASVSLAVCYLSGVSKKVEHTVIPSTFLAATTIGLLTFDNYDPDYEKPTSTSGKFVNGTFETVLSIGILSGLGVAASQIMSSSYK